MQIYYSPTVPQFPAT